MYIYIHYICVCVRIPDKCWHAVMRSTCLLPRTCTKPTKPALDPFQTWSAGFTTHRSSAQSSARGRHEGGCVPSLRSWPMMVHATCLLFLQGSVN